jgi:phosphatidate phosphatase PAH1
MKPIIAGFALTTLLIPGAGLAQDVKIPERIEQLSAKAKEVVNVTLDGPLLQLASQFLSSKDTGEQQAKNVVSKLKSIHVRSFEFAKEGEYSEADVAAFRSQLRSPAWSRIVEARDGREHMEVFVKQDKNQASGLVMISTEPKELTIVNIDGSINLNELANLGGQFGIPKIDASASKAAGGPAPAVASRTRSAERDSAE